MKIQNRRRIQIDAIYDIECQDWTQFVCGGYLKSNGDFYLYSDHISADSHRNQDAMANCILSNGGHVWAHYGGKYDHKWLIDIAARRQHGCILIAAGARIISATIGHLKLRDSFALIPVSLAELTESQGVHKEKLDLPCICGDDCGGYCSIARGMPTPQYRRLCDYLRADCESLKESLERVQDFGDEHDIDLCPTVGSSSWRTMQRWLNLPNADLDPNDHNFVRSGYFGGKVLLAIPGTTFDVEEYDVSGMYPWSMSSFPMPDGIHRSVSGSDARAAFDHCKPGIYNATIDVPEMHLPPLPYRIATRVAYPFGTISGTWALPEIQYAESIGCKVLDVHRAMIWSHEEIKFAPYVDKLFDLRLLAGKTTPQGIWLKFMLNAPTGKMGSSPDKDRFLVNPDYIRKCNGTGPCWQDGKRDCGRCCERHCTRKCGAMAEHSDYIWSEYKYHLDTCAHIEWASYLTANARVEQHKQHVSVDNGLDVVYGDTDSCYALNERSRRLGSTKGLWEYKGRCSEFHGIAPKTYWFVRDGKTVSKAKGLNAPRDKPIEVGREYPARGVVGLRKGASLGTLFTKKADSRIATQGTGDRILLDDGTTRAPHVRELGDLL